MRLPTSHIAETVPLYFSGDPPSRPDVKYTTVMLNTSVAGVWLVTRCNE